MNTYEKYITEKTDEFDELENLIKKLGNVEGIKAFVKKYPEHKAKVKSYLERRLGKKNVNEAQWPDHEAIWGKPKRHDYKDLGYANGWKDTPKPIEACERKGHKIKAANVGRNLTEYF